MSSDEEKYFNIPTDRTLGELKSILKKIFKYIKYRFRKKENIEKFWFI